MCNTLLPPPPVQEGAGHALPTAYVEVVFDNSDGRFPVSGSLGVKNTGSCVRAEMVLQPCELPWMIPSCYWRWRWVDCCLGSTVQAGSGAILAETVTIQGNCAYRSFPRLTPFCCRCCCLGPQIDRDEVRLRRTISKSKDEYHLDKKPIP